jgi:hypothetical protein
MHGGRLRALIPLAWEQQEWKEGQENTVGEKGCMEKKRNKSKLALGMPGESVLNSPTVSSAN